MSPHIDGDPPAIDEIRRNRAQPREVRKEMHLTTNHEDSDRVGYWVTECMRPIPAKVRAAKNLKRGPEREIWDCTVDLAGSASNMILSVFRPRNPRDFSQHERL